jgi:hypothetical protein
MDFVDNWIQQWAGTSGDTAPRALITQKAVAREFNLPLGRLEKVMDEAGPDYLTHLTSNEMYDRFERLFRTSARLQYEYTQERLAAAGVKEMILYRGQGLPAEVLPSVPGWGETAYTASISLQPISSFSTTVKTATNFIRGPIRVISGVKVPRNQIFGSYKTGFGCLNEQEIVLLGGDDIASHTFYSRAGLPESQAEFQKAVKQVFR